MAMAQPKMGRPKNSARVREEGAIPDPKSIGMRVTGEYALWLEGLATKYRTSVAGIIDRALAEWSEAEGYEHRPPRRTP